MSDKPEAVAFHVFGGGMLIGFQQAGVKVTTDLETFPQFQESVTANRPKIDYRRSDDAEFDWNELRGTPILFGNPRCSGFSPINAGVEGRHGHDSVQTIDLRQFWTGIKEIRPKIAVFESVQQAATVGRKLLDEIAADLRPLGYKSAEVLFNNYHLGVPQHRKRFFGVYYQDGLTFNVDPIVPKHVTVWDCIQDLADVPARVFSSANLSKAACDDTVHGYTANGRPVYNHVCYPLTEENQLVVPFIKEGQSLYDLTDDELKHSPKLYAKRKKGTGFSWAPVQRVSSVCSKVIYSRSFTYVHPKLNRTITIREAARLMDFPDDWVFRGAYPFVHVGNGVSVRTSRWIAGEVLKCLRGAWTEDFEVRFYPSDKQTVKKAPADPWRKRFELNSVDGITDKQRLKNLELAESKA